MNDCFIGLSGTVFCLCDRIFAAFSDWMDRHHKVHQNRWSHSWLRVQGQRSFLLYSRGDYWSMPGFDSPSNADKKILTINDLAS